MIERLRDHGAQGRLDPDELAERVERAYAARTRGELGAITNDLPRPARGEPVASRHERPELRGSLAAFVLVNSLLIAIWAASGGGYFWPVWPLLGWGIGVASHGWGFRPGMPVGLCGTRADRPSRAPSRTI